MRRKKPKNGVKHICWTNSNENRWGREKGQQVDDHEISLLLILLFFVFLEREKKCYLVFFFFKFER